MSGPRRTRWSPSPPRGRGSRAMRSWPRSFSWPPGSRLRGRGTRRPRRFILLPVVLEDRQLAPVLGEADADAAVSLEGEKRRADRDQAVLGPPLALVVKAAALQGDGARAIRPGKTP